MTTKIIVFGPDGTLMQVNQTMIKVCSKNTSLNIFLEIHASDILILFAWLQHKCCVLHCTHTDCQVHKPSEKKDKIHLQHN